MDYLWNTVLLEPMINLLIWLYGLMGHNYLLAIIAVTVISRLITWPLTAQQQKSSIAMAELQPKLKQLQTKHKGDPEQLQKQTMELYKEAGVNPFGGCLPLLIQMPILFGLYQALRASLAATPRELLTLSQHIYHPVPSWLAWLPDATSLIPLNNQVGWLNLGQPDPLFILPVLVVVSTWFQSKLMTPPSTDPQQAMTSQMMLWMMPAMIGFFSLSFPSGLSIYWVAANLIGFVQYGAQGRLSLKNLFGTEDGSFSWRGLAGLPQPASASRTNGRSRRK